MRTTTIHNFSTDFLPVNINWRTGSRRDYLELERFHYVPIRPATWARVIAATVDGVAGERVIGVGVLSYPYAFCHARTHLFALRDQPMRERLKWANANVRNISRVIVHPQFRSLGLAGQIISRLIHDCETPIVEVIARMGYAHPMFERAGMTRFDPRTPLAPIYFYIDRRSQDSIPTKAQIGESHV